jgi:hypothetical protein
MRLALLFLMISYTALFAQDAPPETIVTPLGIPCEPGEPSPFGPEFPLACPPVEQQGVMVFVKGAGEPVGFKATIKYTNADGEQKEESKTVARNPDNEWTVIVFQIGRLKTEKLAGNTIDETKAEPVDTVPEPEPVE